MLRLEQTQVTRDGFDFRVDLSLAAGERLGVMGASGSGKSTLLSLIAGFVTPDAGRVFIDDKDVTDRPVAGRPLSILFQDGNLFPHLSAFDNVALGLSPRLRLSGTQAALVRDCLAKVGLSGMEARRPADLSGGQQSRVALARMLLRGRPVALLDEPFAALDPGLRHEMVALLDALGRETGQTMVMVTHDFDDVTRLCDRVVLLEDGRAVLDMAVSDAIEARPAPLAAWL